MDQDLAPYSPATLDSNPQTTGNGPLSEEDAAAWITLIRTPGIGSRRLLQLLKHFHHPKSILSASQHNIKAVLNLPQNSLDALSHPDTSQLKTDLDWLTKDNNHLITFYDSRYPALLREITDPPAALFLSGNPQLLCQPQLAMVGSRNPDHYGQDSAFEFAKALAKDGLIITSGLALGIDGASHKGALEGGGETIAVAATGLDRVYPARHRDLAHRIVQQGAIVSEHPLGTQPVAGHFPRRNRIISGLSLGTFVVQAATQSGSLITARLALEQDRDVFALPGSVHNPLSRGCHQLIRQGAKLVESTQDILEELAPQLKEYLRNLHIKPLISPNEQTFTLPVNNEIMNSESVLSSDSKSLGQHQRILELMGYEPVSIDDLVERSQFSSEIVSCLLLELELTAQVKSFAGLYSRDRQHEDQL